MGSEGLAPQAELRDWRVLHSAAESWLQHVKGSLAGFLHQASHNVQGLQQAAAAGLRQHVLQQQRQMSQAPALFASLSAGALGGRRGLKRRRAHANPIAVTAVTEDAAQPGQKSASEQDPDKPVERILISEVRPETLPGDARCSVACACSGCFAGQLSLLARYWGESGGAGGDVQECRAAH